MLNSYCKFSVPQDLTEYYHVSNVIESVMPQKVAFNLSSDMIINRDKRGRVISVKYYSPEKELVKEVFYTGESISKVNHYRNMHLYLSEEYKNDLVSVKYKYKPNGDLAHTLEYDYNKKAKITRIRKKCSDEIIKAEFKYDEFERITDRSIYKNNEKLLEQHYKYDILDRLIEYEDNHQAIKVLKVNNKQELLNYEITDKIGNKIAVENVFMALGYAYSQITVNDHSTVVKDKSYVDNMMLKKPYTTDEDLDFIIANLFNESPSAEGSSEPKPSANKFIDIDNINIEQKLVPISLRKRILYNIMTKV